MGCNNSQVQRSNAGKPWMEEEESSLIHDFQCGSTISELAQQPQRTERAICFRLEQLGEIKTTAQ